MGLTRCRRVPFLEMKTAMIKILLISAIFLGGCTHQPLSWNRTGDALAEAASHPSVWAPLLGASVFMIEDLDNSTTKHLADDTPVFGSNSAADTASSDCKQVLMITTIVSALTAPVSEDENAMAHRGDHLVVAIGGMKLTEMMTQGIKQSVARERPDGSSDGSFPSGHSSQAFFFATTASSNFHQRWGDSRKTKWMDAGLYSVASLSAYARIEANAHHPADVLFGASLGNFLGRFLNGLFLEESGSTSLSTYYDGKNFNIGVTQQF